MSMQPHWMHRDDRSNVLRGQLGGRASNSVWCGQNVDWISLPNAGQGGSGWAPITIPPHLDSVKPGDSIQIERIGDTWQLTLILKSDDDKTTTTGGTT